MFRVEDILQLGRRLAAIDPSKQQVIGKDSIVNDLYWVRDALNRNNIDTEIASRIYDFSSRIDSEYRRKPTQQTLDYSDQQTLIKNVELWFALIGKDVKQRKILEPAKMGILNQEQLYETSSRMVNEFFSDWWKMSSIEREDFAEGARCLLAQSWTAAAMIALRGLESILRKYYTFKTQKEVGRRGMYTLIDELQVSENISQTLLGYLNYLRGIRNTAEHPDRVFNQIGAETVFAQVAGAAREMYEELK